jgi:hypothetical protein
MNHDNPQKVYLRSSHQFNIVEPLQRVEHKGVAMPSIRELLESSVLVIVQYHKAKLPKSPGTESETMQNLLQKPHTDMVADLITLIDASVTTNSRDEARRPLMMYILHNIELLRSYLDSPTPIEEPAFKLIKKQVIQYVVDVHRLLHLSQATEMSINYNQHELKLFGLMSRAWGLYSLCTSGRILQTTLLLTLGLSTEASEDKAALTVSDLFNEHQRSLLNDQISVFIEQQAELTRLREEVAALKLELQDIWKDPLETNDSEPSTEVAELERIISAMQLELENTQAQLRLITRDDNSTRATRPNAKPKPPEKEPSLATIVSASARWANSLFEAPRPPVATSTSVNTQPQRQEVFNISEWF